jgi:riboflavin synthase
VFTGIVEELGTIRRFEGGRIEIGTVKLLEGARIGDSIAINGCCLTVVDIGPHWFGADAVAETLQRTNLRHLKVGDAVNLERPLQANDRLGGHIVQGHVDTVGEVVSPAPELQVRMDPDLTRYVVEKGSITVDGVSLTVVKALPDGFTVAVIPHTAAVTTLGRRQPGDSVNLEVDLIAKYVEKMMAGPERPFQAE